MGQIVIDIPSNKNRHYVVSDHERADALLDELESTAVRVKNDKTPSRQPAEDAADGARAEKILRSMKTTYSHERVKEILGI